MKSAAWNRIAAVMFGLILFIVIAEFGSRVVFNRVMDFNVEMWKYAQSIKTTGVTSGLRFEHQPGARTDLMGVKISINSNGMRGPEVSHNPFPGTYRVAVIGDSITLGWGVSEKETFPRRLEGMLDREMQHSGAGKVEVLNFGVGNYNIEDEYRILREKVVRFQPHVLLLALFINDAEPASSIGDNFLLENSCFAVWLWGRLDALYRKSGFRADYEEYYKGLYSAKAGGLDRMRSGIANIADLCRREGITPIALILPDLHQLTDYPFTEIHEKLGSIGVSRRVPVLDLYPAVRGMEPETLWVSHDDTHPNGFTHGLYAQAIFAGIDWKKVMLEGPEQ